LLDLVAPAEITAADGQPSPARERKGARLYRRLKRLIVLGELAQGTSLIELQLAAEFGCSQALVREALLRLKDDGLVVRDSYRGSSVSTTSALEAAELIALRLRIETQGVRHGMAAIGPVETDALASRVAAMERLAAEGDLFAITEADRGFHLAILGHARLPALEPLLDRCMLLLHRFALTRPSRRRSDVETARRHWPIVEAIRSRSPAQAADALERHIATVVEGPVE
jgi:DNA-binding GntR family transcriptional regulator